MTTFTVAGVSKTSDRVKVRFCSDLVLRVKNLQKQGDTDIQLVELPVPMTKFDACQFLLDSGQYDAFAADIIETQGKKEPKNAVVIKAAPKAPVVDEDLENIKQLAVA
jgi:hypothetical protein